MAVAPSFSRPESIFTIMSLLVECLGRDSRARAAGCWGSRTAAMTVWDGRAR